MIKRKIKRKRINKKINESQSIEQFDNIIKIAGIVILILVVFYLITTWVLDMNKKKDEEIEEAYIQYNEILAGETFNKVNEEYYVIFYDFKAHDASIYGYLIDKYKQKDDTLPVYEVNLSNGFNALYISPNSNKKATRSADLKINGPTIIKIRKGKNVLYKEGKEEIKKILES